MRFFETDHLKHNLKRRGAHGSTAMFASRGLIFLFDLGGTAVLARLLEPSDFGLVAMAMVVLRFATMFRDIGLSEATVWSEKTSQELVSALFWITVAVGIFLSLLLGAAAPLVARFYGEPRLVAITLWILPSLIFSSLAMQHKALLRRQMRFGRLAAINTASTAIAVIIAISCAAGGLGFWALVVKPVMASLCLVVGMWILCPWKPSLPVRVAGLRKMIGFGGCLSLNRLIQFLLRNGDNILIGRFVGSSGLGFYDKAYSLLLFPMRQINNPISSVMVPILSRLQTESVRFRTYYRKALGLTAMATIPFSVFAGVAAFDIIRVVLGPQWDPAAKVFLLLVPAAVCGSINVATGWVYLALGRVHRQLRIKAVTSVLTLLAMFGGVQWGIEGVAIAISAMAVICKWPQLAYCYHGTFVTMKDFLNAVGLPFISSIVAGGFILLVGSIANFPDPGLANLCWKMPAFLLFYSLPFVIIPTGRSKLNNVLDILKELKR